MSQRSFTVTGMSCTGCEEKVEDALRAIDGVSRVEADHETDSVEVTAEGTDDTDLHTAIEDAGYSVAP
ncbi:heavy-metal-associated domain-containing protein [Haloarcula litorea]|uniref:heavy-metal-associated domain-containing protein n=1 Tax=Haloarcula litorea TaxID=3032579 RepID=UPI0023E8091A|nr:heavy-metal-associated domain-containing protein [Halomicroarcula sp. GDY20]